MNYETILDGLWNYWEAHSKERDYIDDGFYSLYLNDDVRMVGRWLPFHGIGQVTSVAFDVPEESDAPFFYITQISMKADGFVLQGENGWFYKTNLDLNFPEREKILSQIKEITGVDLRLSDPVDICE